MSPSNLFLLGLVLCSCITLSLQQAFSCLPTRCPSISTSNGRFTNPRASESSILKIGYLQQNFEGDVDSNSEKMITYSAFTLDNSTSFGGSVSIEIRYLRGPSFVQLTTAAMALFNVAPSSSLSTDGIDALIIETNEDLTPSIAGIAAAYSAPVISINSVTPLYNSKNENGPTGSLFRMTPPSSTANQAMVQVLLSLQKNTTVLIYNQDTYGNAVANDFLKTANVAGITVFSVGLSVTSTNVVPSLMEMKSVVGVNWNTFVLLGVGSAYTYAQVFGYLKSNRWIGKEFLYLVGPVVELASQANVFYLQHLEGALGFLPRRSALDSQQYRDFANVWANPNKAAYFSGPTPDSGYFAYDAVMMIARAAEMHYNLSGAVAPRANITSNLKRVNVSGLSGEVNFDTQGERVGEYLIMNHLDSRSPAKEVGYYDPRHIRIVKYQEFTFFNGTTIVPVLHNITLNMTYFCSVANTQSGSGTTGYSGGATPPPDTSGSSGNSSNSGSDDFYFGNTGNYYGWNGEGTPPNITGRIDPSNTSRCICNPGYGGDNCDHVVEIPTYKKILLGVSVSLGVITFFAVLVAIFASVMLALYWENFRKHGSFYCAVIIVGVFFSYASVVVLLPEPTDALCMAFPWFLGIGFTLVYGCLFIKTWTLYEVHRSAEQLKRTNLTPMSIIKGIGLNLALEIIILIIWTAVDRPGVGYNKMVDDSYQLMCGTKATFWAIFAGVKSVWLVFGAVLSVLSRNVSKEYNESKNIAYATYNIIALLVIGIPLAIALRDVPGGLLIIEVAVILIAFTFTMVSLFFGVWLRIFSNEKMDMSGSPTGTANRKSTQTKTSSNSNKSSDSHSQNSPRSKGLSSSEMVYAL